VLHDFSWECAHARARTLPVFAPEKSAAALRARRLPEPWTCASQEFRWDSISCGASSNIKWLRRKSGLVFARLDVAAVKPLAVECPCGAAQLRAVDQGGLPGSMECNLVTVGSAGEASHVALCRKLDGGRLSTERDSRSRSPQPRQAPRQGSPASRAARRVPTPPGTLRFFCIVPHQSPDPCLRPDGDGEFRLRRYLCQHNSCQFETGGKTR